MYTEENALNGTIPSELGELSLLSYLSLRKLETPKCLCFFLGYALVGPSCLFCSWVFLLAIEFLIGFVFRVFVSFHNVCGVARSIGMNHGQVPMHC